MNKRQKWCNEFFYWFSLSGTSLAVSLGISSSEISSSISGSTSGSTSTNFGFGGPANNSFALKSSKFNFLSSAKASRYSWNCFSFSENFLKELKAQAKATSGKSFYLNFEKFSPVCVIDKTFFLKSPACVIQQSDWLSVIPCLPRRSCHLIRFSFCSGVIKWFE